MASSSATASLSVERAVSTLEERVAEVERKLGELTVMLRKDVNALTETLSAQRIEFEKRIGSTDDQVNALGKKMEHAAVGGFKIQSFGVALAIYGAVTSVYA